MAAEERPEDVVTVRLAGGYPFDQIDRLVRDLAPILTLREPARVVVDLGGLAFVGPTALALLVAALMRLRVEELLADVTNVAPPRSPLTRAYLQRMDLVRLLVGEEPAEDFTRRDPVGFRPCKQFVDESYHLVALDLTEAVAERCRTDSIARGSIRVCLDEIAENVLNHARSPIGGFAAAQGWRRRDVVEVGIVDLGVGIRGSLANNPAYAHIADDVTAIETALQPRVTGNPTGRNSGIGLFITRLLLRNNGGLLVIRSGGAAVYSGAREEGHATELPFPGTIVALRARTDRPLDIGAVYRELGNAGENDRD